MRISLLNGRGGLVNLLSSALLCLFFSTSSAQTNNKAQLVGANTTSGTPQQKGGLTENPQVPSDREGKGILQLTPSLSKSSKLSAETPTRYLSLSIMNVETGDYYLPIMERYASAGVNAFLLNVNWERIYHKRGDQPDWEQIDKEAALAISLGCKIMLRIWVARHDDGDAGWWPESTRPVSGDGYTSRLLGGFSYSATDAVEESNNFIREVVEHFKPRQQAGQILWVGVVTASTSEIGYAVDNHDPVKNTKTIQIFDYSYPTRIAFQSWLQARYQTIGNLNQKWSSDYSRFTDIWPPAYKNDPWQTHRGKAGEDWYLFRHHALKKLVTKYIKTVKEVDPSYKYYHDMGSCYDNMSAIRGTLAFKDLCADADGLKVNDAPSYPHRFAMDLLRSNLPGKMFGNEFERVSYEYKWAWKDQIDRSFEHGADWVNIFGFDSHFHEVEDILRETAARWLYSPRTEIKPTQTITYTLSEAVQQGGTFNAQQRWNLAYAASPGPIKVILTEDLLETTTVNQPPTVVSPIANQQANTTDFFSYEIPKSTFADPDGFISSITASGLPSGMSLVDWRVEGKALTSGESTVTITATDNQGAQVSTQFKLTVVSSNAENNFSIFTAGNILTRRFIRTLQNKDTLRGDILTQSINILVSPRTGTVGSYSLTLSGPKSANRDDFESPFSLFGDDEGIILTPGTYTLTVKSYAAANLQGGLLSVQTINFVVGDGGNKNQPPVLKNPPADLFAKTGNPFDYRLADNVFVDPDGTIKQHSFASLPNGLNGDSNRIWGTPTKEGVFTVKYTVTDDMGATSETSFKFTVTSGNLPPVANRNIPNQTAQLNKSFSYHIGENIFTDPDGQIVSIVFSGLPEGLSTAGKLILGTPQRSGTFPVTVTATDNGNATVQLTFSLTVTSTDNKLPIVAKPLTDQEVDQNANFRFVVPAGTFTDPDGTIARLEFGGLPTGLTALGDTISGRPTQVGEFNITVRAFDNGGGSVETTFKIKVKLAGSGPIVPDMAAKVGQYFSYRIPDSLFVSAGTTVRFFTITFLPPGLDRDGNHMWGVPNLAGVYTVRVSVVDSKGNTIETSFRFTVTSGNLPPVVNRPIDNQTAQLNQPYSFTVPDQTFTDPDGQIVGIAFTGLPEGLSSIGKLISGTPQRAGTYPVTVTATDNGNATVQLTFSLTVTSTNNKLPVVTKPLANQEVDQNATFRFVVPAGTFTDPDGTIARLEFGGLPTGLTASGDTISGRPTQVGEFSVSVRAFDNSGGSVETTFKIKVKLAGNGPIVPDMAAKVGEYFSYRIPDSLFVSAGTTVRFFTITFLPPGLDRDGNHMWGVPNLEGVYTVRVSVVDSKDNNIETSFRFTVTSGNLPPVVNRPIDNQTAQLNQPYSYTVPDQTFTDPDGQIVSIAFSGLPEGLSSAGKLISGTPQRTGTFPVTVTATDNGNATVQLTFSLTVTSTDNKLPIVAKPLTNQEVDQNATFRFVVPAGTFTDPDGTIARLEFGGLPTGLTALGDTISGRPTQVGEFSVSVRAFDNSGGSVETTFKIKVKSTGKEPVVADIVAKVGEYFSYRIPDSLFVDTGTTVRFFTITFLPPGLNRDGNHMWGVPTLEGVYTVRVSVVDSKGNNIETTFKFTVTSGNLPPVANRNIPNQTAQLNKSYSYHIGEDTFTDPDGQIVSIVFSGLPDGLSSAGKLISGTPQRTGTFPVTVTATDNGNATVQLTFSFTVTSSENKLPIVAKPLTNQEVDSNAVYRFVIPAGTFTDPDGTIARLEFGGMPIGLSASGDTISGRPTQVGEFTITVRAFDNSGGTVETTFKLKVKRLVPNKPPVLKKTPVDLAAKAGATYSYSMPDSTFVDPDGTISTFSLTGLPDGLRGDGNLISGTPTKVGMFTVTYRVVDNKGASSETTFKFTISAQNLPPVAKKEIYYKTAEVNKPFTYTLPDSLFVDPDGQIVSIVVSGLPEGIKSTPAGLISGTPQVAGSYTVTITATDNDNATAQIKFTLLVLPTNQPPIVTNTISNQEIDSNAVYRFVIPLGTFTDPDGTIVRLEISGLPAGLTAKGDTISGRTGKVGDYTIVVRAFDDRAASVATTFRLKVVGLNHPPILKKPIPDMTLIMGQVFYFDVTSYFRDPDGSIASISYAATLPPGITANGAQIAGNPTAVGEYIVNVIAKDDKGATTEVMIKLIVVKPELQLFLYQADAIPQKKILEFSSSDNVLPIGTLPPILNIFAESNANITLVTFSLTGPTETNSADDTKPFGLFGDNGGFSPQIGIYKLKVVAFRNTTEVVSRTIQFNITAANSRPGRLGVEEFNTFSEAELWKPYPNPYIDEVHIQTPPGQNTQLQRVEVFTSEGKDLPLSNAKWRMNQSLLDIDLSETTQAPGMYLLRITEENGQQKMVRILKKAAQ